MSPIIGSGLKKLGGIGGSVTVFSDTFARADGSLGNAWSGAAWDVTSNQARNNLAPTNLVSNPSFETAGSGGNDVFGSWIEQYIGATTLNDDTTTAHTGTHSIRFDEDASNNATRVQQNLSMSAGFLELAIWAKATANGDTARFGFSGRQFALTTNWAQYFETAWNAGGNIFPSYFAAVATSHSVWGDDYTCYVVTLAQSLALRTSSLVNAAVGAALTIPNQSTLAGVALCFDSTSSPANGLLCWHDGITTITLAKVVSGVLTTIAAVSSTVSSISGATVRHTYAAGAMLEVRKESNIVKVYYAGVQVGTSQDVSALSTIVNNTCHGMFSTNAANRLDDYYQEAPNSLVAVGFGGSITQGSIASDNLWWMAKVPSHLYTLTPHIQRLVNAGIGGTPSWYGLVRLQSDVLANLPSSGVGIVFIDFAVNGDGGDVGSRTLQFRPVKEAMVRRILTYNPSLIPVPISFVFPELYSYNGTARKRDRDEWQGVGGWYGLDFLNWGEFIAGLIGPGYTDPQVEVYLSGVGDVHPNTLGHLEAFHLIQSRITALTSPPAMPSNYYFVNQYGVNPTEVSDYLNTPVVRYATDNDGTTLSWTPTGTGSHSLFTNNGNATISWTGTYCSFGLDVNVGVGQGTIAWKVDGGSYTNIDLSTFSVPYLTISNFARAAHTVTIKLVSGVTTINRFMAV